jgi:hypothetical protein
MTMLRTVTVVAVLSALLALSACGGPGTEATDESTGGTSGVAGCGECTEELATLRGRIEDLAGVRELVTLHTYADSPTNGAGVKVELRSTGSGDSGVQDRVAELVWKSPIAPLDEVVVAVEDADGELVATLPYDFTATGRQHDTYVEQWGERPVTG